MVYVIVSVVTLLKLIDGVIVSVVTLLKLIDGVIVSVVASSVEDCGFKSV
jgi:hypothetical protein